MFCNHCGQQIADNSVFCGHCGAPVPGNQPQPVPSTAYQQPAYQQPVYQQPAYQQPTYQQSAPAYQTPVYNAPPIAPTVPQRSSSDTLRMIFGIVLIACGLIPYLFFTSVGVALSHAMAQAVSYGDIPVAIISALSAFFNMTDALLRFPTRMLTIITGIVLLQNRWKPKGAAIACAVFNLLYSLLTFLAAVIVQVMPEIILSLYSNSLGNSDIIQKLNLQEIIWQNTLPQLLLCLVTAGLCFGFLFCKVQPRHVHRDRSVSNLYILIPFLGLLRLFVNLLPTILSGVFMGNVALAAWSSANSVVTSQTGSLYLWGFIAVTALCLLLRKLPFGWTALAAGGAMVLYAVVVFLSLDKHILELNMPAEYVAYMLDYSRTILFGNALMMAAVLIWIVAITRNCVPLWLQWVLSCGIILVYILAEVFCCAALCMGVGYGLFACAGVILLATLLTGFLNAGKAKQMQYA